MRTDALRRALVAPAGPYAALDVVASVASTNTALAAAARDGAPDRTVLIAEHQTAGRGRAARSWVAPARSGLALSVLLRPEVPQPRWSWLPLLAGVALCRTVSTLGELPTALKWPNDLLLGADQRKAAGILAEVVPDSPAVVVGIGLNVTLRPDELPAASRATSMAIEQAACADRDPLLRALLRALDREVRVWCEHDGDPDAAGLRQAYLHRCATVGEQVRVELPGPATLTGTAVDVDTEGRLVVSSEGQRSALSAGDVTHVRPAVSFPR